LIHTTGSLVQVGDRLIGARPCARRLIPSLLEALLGLGQAYSGEVELLKGTETTDHRRSQRGRRVGPLFSWEVPSVFFASLS
jgi:hypothetical protein